MLYLVEDFLIDLPLTMRLFHEEGINKRALGLITPEAR